MTRLDALKALAEKVDAGEIEATDGPGAFKAFGFTQMKRAASAYHGSLDAAKALHDAVLSGWFPGMSQNIHSGEWYVWVQTKTAHKQAFGNNPARAWLLAILRALIAQEAAE